MKIYRDFKKQFNAHVFTPTWKYRTPKDWVREYEHFIIRNKIKDFIGFGFSMGAYIMACSSIQPKKSIYGSISPFFKEDSHRWTKSDKKFFGSRRFMSMMEYKRKPKSIFIYGENEPKMVPDCIKRISAHDKVVVVKDTPHRITPKYFGVIKSLMI